MRAQWCPVRAQWCPGHEGGGLPRQFIKRYPPIHDLVELYERIKRTTSFVPKDESFLDDIKTITKCSGTTINTLTVQYEETAGEKISCQDFYKAAMGVDRLLLEVVEYIKTIPPTTPNPLVQPSWLTLKSRPKLAETHTKQTKKISKTPKTKKKLKTIFSSLNTLCDLFYIVESIILKKKKTITHMRRHGLSPTWFQVPG